MKSNRLQGYIDKYKDQFNTSMLFGIPIIELNKDELMATICFMNELSKDSAKEHQRQIDFLSGLGKLSGDCLVKEKDVEKVYILKWSGNMKVEAVYLNQEEACIVARKANRKLSWLRRLFTDKWVVHTYDVKEG